MLKRLKLLRTLRHLFWIPVSSLTLALLIPLPLWSAAEDLTGNAPEKIPSQPQLPSNPLASNTPVQSSSPSISIPYRSLDQTQQIIQQQDATLNAEVKQEDTQEAKKEQIEENQAQDNLVSEETQVIPTPDKSQSLIPAEILGQEESPAHPDDTSFLEPPAGPPDESPIESSLSTEDNFSSTPSSPLDVSELPNPDALISHDIRPPDSESQIESLTPPPAPLISRNPLQQEHQQKVRYQKLKIQVQKEPELAALQKQVRIAKTDEIKRATLRVYYRLLFTRISELNPGLKSYCDRMEWAYLRSLGQYRVEPTIPLQAPPAMNLSEVSAQ